MTRDEFLERLGKLNIWRRGAEHAPHKPLLLLWALGKIRRESAPTFSYEIEVKAPLQDLLERFGPQRKKHHPEMPFWRLRSDKIWYVRDAENLVVGRGGQVSDGTLIRQGASGGFTDDVYRLLRSDPGLVETATNKLLHGHFPRSLHDAIRDRVGLPRGWLVEDAIDSILPFRQAVLSAYERRCAVCAFDVRVADDLIGLGAAHIKWPVAGGPDKVQNGLALCSLHHKAFDMGALGLEPVADTFRVLVSSEINGQSDSFLRFLDFRGAPLRQPQSPEFQPAPEFIHWHREEVFRGEPRPFAEIQDLPQSRTCP